MMTRYKRVQKSWLYTFITIAAVLVTLTAAGLVNRTEIWIACIAISVTMLALSTLFASMTVEVTDTDLRWHFGPGFWKKQLARADIRSAEPTRTKWWYGWGIRATPRGWLYNVYGLDAVAVTTTDGRTVLIGTNDPSGLASALARG